MPDTRTTDLIYSTLRYFADFPAKQLLLFARPAGFEPATGGLEVRDEHLPLRVVLCRKVLVCRKSVTLRR